MFRIHNGIDDSVVYTEEKEVKAKNKREAESLLKERAENTVYWDERIKPFLMFTIHKRG